MTTIQDLENEINQIKERNKKVELDKAWETSWIRKVLLFILTYIVIVIFFLAAELPNPFINSLVPAIAFVLSTSTMPIFKKIWLAKKSKE